MKADAKSRWFTNGWLPHAPSSCPAPASIWSGELEQGRRGGFCEDVTFPRSEIGPCVDGSLGVTACEVYADVRIVARHRASLA